MTTFFQPLQRESDKRWDYTRRTNSVPPHPIGYCGGWNYDRLLEAMPEADPHREYLVREMHDHEPLRAKYHTNGHATAEEAEHCHDTYLLDTALVFRRSDSEQHRCVVCKDWGQNLADVRGENIGPHHWLCDAHANRESYEPAFRARFEVK
jgi:hypothetical protein